MNREQAATDWLEEGTQLEPLDRVVAHRYCQLMHGLSPLLGMGATGLLFARAMQQTARQFPFLKDMLSLQGTETTAERLRMALSLQDPETALKAGTALLSAFMTLLDKLIGSELSTHLLQQSGLHGKDRGKI